MVLAGDFPTSKTSVHVWKEYMSTFNLYIHLKSSAAIVRNGI